MTTMTATTTNPCCWGEPKPMTTDLRMAFNGTVDWSDGTKAMTCEHNMLNMLAVADQNGIEVLEFGDEDEPAESAYRLKCDTDKLSPWMARALLKNLPTSDKALIDAGFEFFSY